MSDLDTLLREAIHAHADAGVPRRVWGLATVAQRRARRRRNRQLVVGATMVLAVLAAGAVAIPQLTRSTGEAPLAMAPPSYLLPAFPYTPGWVPDGVADPHVLLWDAVPDQSDRQVVVEHEAAGDADTRRTLIQLRILSAGEFDPSAWPDAQEVTVRGAAATLTDDGRWLSVTWTDPAGRLVQVGASDRQVGQDNLLRYIEELVEAPLPVTPPVRLAVAPVGSELSSVSPDTIFLDLPDGRSIYLVTHDPALADELWADVLGVSPDRLPPPVPVTVAGRPAELVDIGSGRLALSIRFEPDLALTVEFPSPDRDILLTFAEGITLTDHARPALFG